MKRNNLHIIKWPWRIPVSFIHFLKFRSIVVFQYQHVNCKKIWIVMRKTTWLHCSVNTNRSPSKMIKCSQNIFYPIWNGEKKKQTYFPIWHVTYEIKQLIQIICNFSFLDQNTWRLSCHAWQTIVPSWYKF